MSTQQLKQKGFTIIEVVLVLAIAALIFLMVFIALPALQRNQRDQDRKTVAGKVASGITTFQSNKRGAQPGNGRELAGYIDGEARGNHAIVGNAYEVRVGNRGNGAGAASLDIIQVFTQSKCATDASGLATTNGATRRNAAVVIQTENGSSNGNPAYFCQEV